MKYMWLVLVAVLFMASHQHSEPEEELDNGAVAASSAFRAKAAEQLKLKRQAELEFLEAKRLEEERIAAEEAARIAEEARVNRVRVPMDYFYVTGEWGEYDYLHPGGHNAIDFGNDLKEGETIYPLAKGVVSFTGSFTLPYEGCGNYVAVWHEQLDVTSIYCHLSSIDVALGQSVDPDTRLGGIGTTGFSTGIHLHLGVYPGNQFTQNSMNPREFLASYGVTF